MVGHPRTMASATRRVRSMCATSCTRTMSAPDAIARATVALAIAAGADIVRVHDVAHIARTRRVADAIVRG